MAFEKTPGWLDWCPSPSQPRFKLPPGVSTDDIMRELRGRAPGDPVEP